MIINYQLIETFFSLALFSLSLSLPLALFPPPFSGISKKCIEVNRKRSFSFIWFINRIDVKQSQMALKRSPLDYTSNVFINYY